MTARHRFESSSTHLSRGSGRAAPSSSWGSSWATWGRGGEPPTSLSRGSRPRCQHDFDRRHAASVRCRPIRAVAPYQDARRDTGSAMSTVVALQLTHRFGSELALDAVDLVLDRGEHLAVLGENGAGKTTLLRVLATAARPTSGTLELFGVDAWRERKRVRARIGYVGHALGLYPALSAAENLEFFCSLQGVSRSRVAETL